MNRRAAYEQQIRDRIDSVGYTFIGVFDPDGVDPPFAYSLGLVSKDLPELIVIGGLPLPVAEYVLDAIAKLWIKEDAPVFGDISDIIQDFNLRVVEIDPVATQRDFAAQHAHFYPLRNARWAQVLWPDTAGLFPGDEGYKYMGGQAQIARL